MTLIRRMTREVYHVDRVDGLGSPRVELIASNDQHRLILYLETLNQKLVFMSDYEWKGEGTLC